MAKPDYDTTVARIAGNIASGFVSDPAVGWPMDAGAAKVRTEPVPAAGPTWRPSPVGLALIKQPEKPRCEE